MNLSHTFAYDLARGIVFEFVKGVTQSLSRTFAPLIESYSDGRLILATLLLSSVLGIAAMARGQPLTVTAGLTLLPWLPMLARKIHGDWTRYGVLAIFELLVIFQFAHFAEHVSQVAELHWLDWPSASAKGVVGNLDIEPVHFWWNSMILMATTLLLLHFRKNGWLWASFFFSIWHELEHLYIYFVWFLPQSISGHPGLLGADGVLEQANVYIPILTDLSRADLHFWYNFFEIGLFAVAFVVQARRTMNPHPSPPPPLKSATREGAYTPIPRSRVLSVSKGRGGWEGVLFSLALIQIPLLLGVALAQASPPTLRVPEDYAAIQDAIDFAPGGAIIRIAPGTYDEAIQIRKPLTLIGAPDGTTRIGGGHATTLITIRDTHDVTLKQLTIVGGEYGILVEESQAVNIVNNRVVYAWFAGIRLSRASAQIVGNDVRATFGPYGMGIELANTVSRPASLIRANAVSASTHEGIVLHNARATIEQNDVVNNGLRGIAITEMSEAMVRGNTLTDNADAGIYVVDMSMAEVDANHIRAVRAGPLGDAHGIRAEFHAEVMLGNNWIEGEPTQAVVARSDAIVERRSSP